MVYQPYFKPPNSVAPKPPPITDGLIYGDSLIICFPWFINRPSLKCRYGQYCRKCAYDRSGGAVGLRRRLGTLDGFMVTRTYSRDPKLPMPNLIFIFDDLIGCYDYWNNTLFNLHKLSFWLIIWDAMPVFIIYFVPYRRMTNYD
jgi:hypothetical protein